MDTVYPNDDEIKFRKDNYGDVEDILNSEVKCTICYNDLLHEIISKKMIMVHQSHLFLCCYNCFYKLCEGNKYSCILCKSNKDLSNCTKCNLNVCNRCVQNQKLVKISVGVLNECFNCIPKMLWEKRAQAANVLKVFYSQLCLPNGLLVNETNHNQAVRKYLIKEAKVGNNSNINNIKDNLCINFVLKKYKSSIVNELSIFSSADHNRFDEHLNGFINLCELVLENTCSTLTDLKRIFNNNSHLSPGVSAIMKSLLKPVDEDENLLVDNSLLNGNLRKETKNNSGNSSSKKSNKHTTRSLRSEKKEKKDTDNLNSTVSLSSSSSEPPVLSSSIPPILNAINQNVSVVLERIDDSIVSSIMSKKVLLDLEKDEIAHPLNLFDITDSDDSSEGTRKLRNRTLIKTNKTKNSTKNQKKLDEKSEDEKENDRLTNLNGIEHRSKKKVATDEEDNSDDTDITPAKNTSLKRLPKNEVNKLENINQFLSTIDETDSGTDNDSLNEENSLESVKGIFTEIKNSVGISQINTEDKDNGGDESDDSSIDDVINACLTACNRHNIDHYNKKTQLDINNMDTIIESDESENNGIDDLIELSDINNETTIVTRSRRISPLKISSTSDSDSDFDFKVKTKGTKRKLLASNSSKDSDSSSKFFKRTPKKKKKTDINKTSVFDLTSNNSSNTSNTSSSSSNEDSSPILVKKRRRMPLSNVESEESSGSDKSDASHNHPLPKKGRKNIRKIIKKDQLSEVTQSALKEEELRMKRIEKRQKEYNKLCDPPTPIESCKKLVLDFDEKTLEELVTVHPGLIKFLKPHQVKGITFLWNSVFESMARIKEHKGNGSILAHCMGLGKTLQIIALVHTLFRYPETGIKTVLVITPNATIENWCKEFHKWLQDIDEERNFSVLNFTDSKTYEGRKSIVEEWKREHGVLVTSYQLFRSVVNYKNIDKFPTISEGLVDPGPDLVICDEGHMLKNHSTATSKAVNRIKTLRRIVLTGTPLQNNLREYHCMVDFIRPNLLGSIKDFTNRFINPITNGQYSDSTAADVRFMKRRSHVLHRMLEGFVQRFDYKVLTPFLPPKHEYVIYLKMADKQIELYRKYLDEYRQPELFSNYHMLQMVWTHPKLLALYLKRVESKQEKQKLKVAESRFLTGDISDVDDNSNSVDEVEIPGGFDLPNTKNPDVHYTDWWKPFVSRAEMNSVYPYSKFIMMFSILQECEHIGDKVLLFSQSLFTLDLIQDFLENAEDLDDQGGPYGKSWDHGVDFYRIDGSVNSRTREDFCEQFNDKDNTRMRLLLLSTKAFNLGINLIGANRVIIFDVTWNPSLNVQSIFRVFRFGQEKPCYIYRFISEGTMEQKIYERQISKLSTAFRVIDEHQIDPHFTLKCQEELYEFEPNTSQPKSTLNLPKDRLMAELILKHKDLVLNILEHDSLLQNNEAEELDENDRNAAWEDYEKERDGIQTKDVNSASIQNLNLGSLPSYRSDDDLTLFNTLAEFFPQASVLEVNDMLKKVKCAQNIEQ